MAGERWHCVQWVINMKVEALIAFKTSSDKLRTARKLQIGIIEYFQRFDSE